MVSSRFFNSEDDEVRGRKRSKHDLAMDDVFGGKFLRVNKDLLAIMTADEANVTSHLANHYKLCGDPREKGWFFCPSENIMAELYMTKNKLTRILKDLESRGVIDTKRKGFSPVKWYFIRSVQIRKTLKYVEREVQAGRSVPSIRYSIRPSRNNQPTFPPAKTP